MEVTECETAGMETQAPAPLIGSAMMAVMASVTQAKVDVEGLTGEATPCSLIVAVVADIVPTGLTRQSSSFSALDMRAKPAAMRFFGTLMRLDSFFD